MLDYARGNPEGLVAVASFHGILDGSPLAPGVSRMRAAVLLCHGDADPFVPEESVQACCAQLRDAGARWSLLQFGGVRHGLGDRRAGPPVLGGDRARRPARSLAAGVAAAARLSAEPHQREPYQIVGHSAACLIVF